MEEVTGGGEGGGGSAGDRKGTLLSSGVRATLHQLLRQEGDSRRPCRSLKAFCIPRLSWAQKTDFGEMRT